MGQQATIYRFHSYCDARQFWIDTNFKLVVLQVSTHDYWVTDRKEAHRLAKQGYKRMEREELLTP